jgi:YidC/Oxa1 family membrane protein insertase
VVQLRLIQYLHVVRINPDVRRSIASGERTYMAQERLIGSNAPDKSSGRGVARREKLYELADGQDQLVDLTLNEGR